jgi:sugar phosphate isomerase/epimerase
MKSSLPLILFIIFGSIALEAQVFKPRFYCFEDAFLKFHTDSAEYQTSLIQKLGFDGMELMGLDRMDQKLASLDQHQLQLFLVYIQIDIENKSPYDTRLRDFIKKVQNKGVTLELHIHSTQFSPSDSHGDDLCVPILQDLADFANGYGVRIALYPHTGFWVEKIDDCLRLIQKVDRHNVGTVFNLCHFLKADEKDLLEMKLIHAIPHLYAVSINGSDDGNTRDMGWDRLIQPLGKGTFNVLHVLRILKANNYTGPIGLQCYNIPGEPAAFLKISIETWRNYLRELSIK